MSYSRMEAKIRADALEDVPRRIAAVEASLSNGGVQRDSLSAEVHQHLCYLERLLASRHDSAAADLRSQVEALRSRANSSLSQISVQEVPLPLTQLAPAAAINGAESTSAHTEPSLVAVASFLRPGQTPERAEDEVRLLSAEGGLAEELSRFPTMAAPGTQSALIMRNVRSWSPEDDEEDRNLERLVVLELKEAVANLREVTVMVGEHVERQRPSLDAVEQTVNDARDSVADAVIHLQSGAKSKNDVLMWLAPSVGLVILGGGAVAIGGAAAAGCVTCVVVRGALTVIPLAVGGFGTTRVHQWQKHALSSMTDQLPRVFDQMPKDVVEMLAFGGREAQRRLLAKIDDSSQWRRFPSVSAMTTGLEARYRPSDARAGGSAWLTSFHVKKLPAFEAFRCLRQMAVVSSWDPGCEVVWSRPIDSAATDTSLRYAIFSEWPFSSRDFYCVCHCAAVEPDGNDGTSGQPQQPQRYVFAVMSLTPELLADSGLPLSNKGIQHGNIYISGIVVTDDGKGGCKVDVMGDVDPKVSKLAPTALIDAKLRFHVLNSAQRVASEFRKCA